ncbi:hypothetical protein GGF43_001132 [Coemansia sp. RSA 2618]|nr:hypothetical protein GGF43_001132 [Coemansia sp. RSA 2618]
MFPGVKVHNPLIDIAIKENQARVQRQQELNAKLHRDVPPTPGSRPLSLEQEYLASRQQFLLDHWGIDLTPTRKFLPNERHDNARDLKDAFGQSRLFATNLSIYKIDPDSVQFASEFSFETGPWSSAHHLSHLTLYVRFLHSAQPSVRKAHMDDFFLIAKAIRQREKGHRKHMTSSEFMKQVMSYLLLSDQPHLAMYLARDYMPKALTKNLCRWHVVRLLENPRLYQPNLDEINNIRKIEGGDTPDPVQVATEYHFNLVAQNLLRYYYDNAEATPTDAELIYLIRCYEARRIKSCLLDMLPMVIRRFNDGASSEVPALDQVQLFYDSDIMVPRVKDYQVTMRYAHALLEGSGAQDCVRTLNTIADMPPKPCGDLSVDTQAAARVLARLVDLGDDAVSQAKQVLHILGTNDVEDVTKPSATTAGQRDQIKKLVSSSRSSSMVVGLLKELVD